MRATDVPSATDESGPPVSGSFDSKRTRWDPYYILISAFFALCAQAGINSGISYIKDTESKDAFDGDVYLFYPGLDWLKISVIVVCIVYLVWLFLQFISSFQRVFSISDPQWEGRRNVGLVLLAIASCLFYIFGSILEPPTHGMVLMALLINIVMMFVPYYVLKGIDVSVPAEQDRIYSIRKSLAGIIVFAILLFVPMTENRQIWLPWVGIFLVVVAALPGVEITIKRRLPK